MSFQDDGHVSGILGVVLDRLSVALLAAGRPVDRVVRFPGPPVWDCEQLTAYPRLRIGGLGTASNPDRARLHIKHVLDINILLTRCVAVSAKGIPPAATVDADGDALATDMWVLQRAIVLGSRDGTLFGNTAGCTVTRFDGVKAEQPSTLSGLSAVIEVVLGSPTTLGS